MTTCTRLRRVKERVSAVCLRGHSTKFLVVKLKKAKEIDEEAYQLPGEVFRHGWGSPETSVALVVH